MRHATFTVAIKGSYMFRLRRDLGHTFYNLTYGYSSILVSTFLCFADRASYYSICK